MNQEVGVRLTKYICPLLQMYELEVTNDGLLLKPGPGPWKTWALKNLDPEKLGVNIGLKNMSDFKELCFY